MKAAETLITSIHLLFCFFLLSSCAHVRIINANVFNVHTGNLDPNQTIIITRERVEAVVSKNNEFKRPLFSKTINAKGRYIIPGLIDAHTHLIYIMDSAKIAAEAGLPLYLGTGVTSVRNIGDDVNGQKRLFRYAQNNPRKSPNIFMCSPLIDGAKPFHGTDPVSIPMSNPDDVPAFIDSLAASGVSTLKIYVYTKPEVYRRVIEEGHKHGMTVAAHLPSNTVKTEDALSWGIDVIEHIWGVPADSAMISMMAQKGIMVDATLVVFKNMFFFNNMPEVWQNKDNDYVPDTLRAMWDAHRKRMNLSDSTLTERTRQMNNYKEMTGRLYRAGVTILAGTDSPEPYCPPGFALHEELQLLVESGLPAAEALKSATIHNAKALKQTKNIGSIEPGKIADMVILDADPLIDIRNTRKIHRIIHRGKILDPKKVLPDPDSW